MKNKILRTIQKVFCAVMMVVVNSIYINSTYSEKGYQTEYICSYFNRR